MYKSEQQGTIRRYTHREVFLVKSLDQKTQNTEARGGLKVQKRQIDHTPFSSDLPIPTLLKYPERIFTIRFEDKCKMTSLESVYQYILSFLPSFISNQRRGILLLLIIRQRRFTNTYFYCLRKSYTTYFFLSYFVLQQYSKRHEHHFIYLL